MVVPVHGPLINRITILIFAILTAIFITTAFGVCRSFYLQGNEECADSSSLNVGSWKGPVLGQIPIALVTFLLAWIPFVTICFDMPVTQLVTDCVSAVVLCVFGGVEIWYASGFGSSQFKVIDGWAVAAGLLFVSAVLYLVDIGFIVHDLMCASEETKDIA
uniref:MARVEL domain-containing protein n=1 Tax=Steinernema glaseri TaxID=37863 RepID=A0A1I8AB29_9BILA